MLKYLRQNREALVGLFQHALPSSGKQLIPAKACRALLVPLAGAAGAANSPEPSRSSLSLLNAEMEMPPAPPTTRSSSHRVRLSSCVTLWVSGVAGR